MFLTIRAYCIIFLGLDWRLWGSIAVSIDECKVNGLRSEHEIKVDVDSIGTKSATKLGTHAGDKKTRAHKLASIFPTNTHTFCMLF